MNILSALLNNGVNRKVAESFLSPLSASLALNGITSPSAVAAFIGQTVIESARYTALSENLYYTTEERLAGTFRKIRALSSQERVKFLRNPERLANFVYADRGGNGPFESGDGWKYRGRGLIQTTFFDNYRDAEQATGRPYLSEPDLLSQPSDAALSAAVYFRDHGCISLAEPGLNPSVVDSITKRINPAMLEADARRRATRIAFESL